MRIFYYFLKATLNNNNNILPNPYCTENFLGDIGDFIEINGIGYIIIDYTEEIVDLDGDSLYW